MINFFGSKAADLELLIHLVEQFNVEQFNVEQFNVEQFNVEQFNNGAVFKRLGFLADRRLHDKKLADECRARLTHGYVKLGPAQRAKKLVTA